MKREAVEFNVYVFSRRIGLRLFYTTIEYLALDYNIVCRLKAIVRNQFRMYTRCLTLAFAAANRFPCWDLTFIVSPQTSRMTLLRSGNNARRLEQCFLDSAPAFISS